MTEFLLKVAMDIQIGAPRVDQHFAGVVIQKEGNVHALSRHLDPRAASASTFPLPGDGAVVIAGVLGNGCQHSIRTDGEAAKFNHPERCAANFRDWRIEDKVTALKQAEALKEQINSGKKSDDAPDGQTGIR